MESLIELKAYLLAKKSAEETYPFGPEAIVFKVKGKLFAIVSEQEEEALHINLKCDP